jgi:hypothetical protein
VDHGRSGRGAKAAQGRHLGGTGRGGEAAGANRSRAGPRCRPPAGQPATALMRAIISSTAFSTGTFSFSTRFIAFAQTFSLLSTVNL